MTDFENLILAASAASVYLIMVILYFIGLLKTSWAECVYDVGVWSAVNLCMWLLTPVLAGCCVYLHGTGKADGPLIPCMSVFGACAMVANRVSGIVLLAEAWDCKDDPWDNANVHGSGDQPPPFLAIVALVDQVVVAFTVCVSAIVACVV